MTTRTRVAMTYEETSPGVPYWGPNTVTTDLLPDQTEIAIENLVAGRTYYIKTWNEDQFGNKSPERLSSIQTPAPTRLAPFPIFGTGVLDSGSPLYTYIKVPDSVLSISEAVITLAFRQFFASAQEAAASGTLTSNTDGGVTTPSGGGSTSGSSSAGSSGSSSASTSDDEGSHYHGFGTVSSTPGAYTNRHYLGSTHGGVDFNVETPSLDHIDTNIASVHNHGMAHTHGIPHTHTTPSHTHDVPNHQHAVPTHDHQLVYGTFEETYPVSHNVSVSLYLLVKGTWIVQHAFTGLTGDLEDIDMTGYIRGPGDWQLRIQSNVGQPNGGRLGCDVYGALTAVI